FWKHCKLIQPQIGLFDGIRIYHQDYAITRCVQRRDQIEKGRCNTVRNEVSRVEENRTAHVPTQLDICARLFVQEEPNCSCSRVSVIMGTESFDRALIGSHVNNTTLYRVGYRVNQTFDSAANLSSHLFWAQI